jgi:thiol-disulfide isomerase/thioredoxin
MKKVKIIFAILVTLLVFLTASVIAEIKKFPKFSTKDINGGIFTSDIFRENAITIVSFWVTWDPFCIEDMSELAEICADLPDDIKIFGILMDGNEPDAIKNAVEILDYAGANFIQLLPSKEMSGIISTIKSTPTTLFVDSGGSIVGKIIVGYCLQDEYLESINDILKDTKK